MSQAGHNQTSLNVGLDLGSVYRLEEEISRGPTASVYRAVDLNNDQPVAIKVFQRRYQRDPRFAIRFREHLRRLAGISHDNLVAIHDYGLDREHYYLVMEWVEGIDLGTYVAEYGALPPALVIYLLRQVCAALSVVHAQGLVHRGIKPTNILLSPDGQVKVVDVGLSGLLSESGLSKTNVMLSGVGYISPEQARGKNISPRSDIYSLGVTLFEALTGRLPFESNDAWSMVRMHALETPPSPREFNRHVPEALADILTRALQKEPEKRFSSAVEMGAALAALQDEFELAWIDQARYSPEQAVRIGFIAMLKDLVEPDTIKGLLSSPTNWQIAGRALPVGVVFVFQFLLTFILTFAIISILA